jgi:hypothetical protein
VIIENELLRGRTHEYTANIKKKTWSNCDMIKTRHSLMNGEDIIFHGVVSAHKLHDRSIP